MKQKNNFLGKLKRYRVLLLMLLPAVLYVILFNYIPMAGIILAFKKYNYVDGIFGSPWNGVDNFRFFFKSGQAWKVTRNTFLYNEAIFSACYTGLLFLRRTQQSPYSRFHSRNSGY